MVRWLAPDVSPETLDLTVFAVRKAAHVTEYAILALLTWVALHGSRRRSDFSPQSASWALALLLTAAYAVSDEIHQGFVAGRTGAAADVFLDVVGAAVGLLLVEQWRRWRQRTSGQQKIAVVADP
jgi:VanZ family protein